MDVDFFKEDGFFLPQQQNFINEHEGHQDISIELNSNKMDSLLIYNCHYDKKVKKRIKISYELIYDSYFEPSDFKIYYNKEKKVIFVGASSELTLAFCKELNDSCLFKLQGFKFDMKDIISKIDLISGLWIGEIKEMHLKSVGFYGENVNHSKKAQDTLNDSETEISSFIATYYSSFFGREFSLLFSKKGSITIHDSLSSDEEYFTLLNEIFEQLLNQRVAQ